MFSKIPKISNMHCFFPVVRTPLQKTVCLGVGLGITGASAFCIGYISKKCDEYHRRNYILPLLNKSSEPKFEPEPEPELDSTLRHEPTLFERVKYSTLCTLNNIMNAFEDVILSPSMKTNDPYAVASSLPVTGFYTFVVYSGARIWCQDLKKGVINVRNADQCCKLVRMSILGSSKHFIFLVGFATWTWIVGKSFYTTSENIYNIVKERRLE